MYEHIIAFEIGLLIGYILTNKNIMRSIILNTSNILFGLSFIIWFFMSPVLLTVNEFKNNKGVVINEQV